MRRDGGGGEREIEIKQKQYIFHKVLAILFHRYLFCCFIFVGILLFLVEIVFVYESIRSSRGRAINVC